MIKPYCYALLCCLAISVSGLAQQSKMKNLPLEDLSAFREQAGNWRIVGGVTMNPAADVHAETAPQPEAPKGKKKRSPKEAVAQKPQAVAFEPGTGILLNINDETKKDQLISKLEHGDIELELEVMLPKGSNSGIYLQGRYELQLFDSWGVKNAKYSDMGGIYRNWENEPGKIYLGKAPLTNAAKAPGLWQKLKISFRAPRFDAAGKKISNATFTHVTLNGVTIHENVEVPLPTGGPLENNEVPTGPLVIQGDHGPVAFRNIRYQLMEELDYKLSPVKYDVFHGNFTSTADFAQSKPVLSGTSPELSADVVDVENAYGIRFTGELTVPKDERYLFTALYTGGAKFVLNDKELFNYPTPDGWRRDTASMVLKAGTYTWEISNFKDASWMPPRLALYVQTSNSFAKPLHGLNSYPPSDNPTSSIFITPGSSPRLVRAFLDFRGDRSKRLTHTIAVGDPSGVHYIYDLKSGNLVCAWRGDFVDATPMWHDRGDGSFRPMGAPLYFFRNQPLASLPNDSEAFPESFDEKRFKGKGYSIEESTNRPVFIFDYNGATFEDRVVPEENNQILTHEITLKEGASGNGIYYKLAEGKSIEQLPDGSYAINDKEYYIKPAAGAKPFIRDVNGTKELVTLFTGQSLKYSIIW